MLFILLLLFKGNATIGRWHILKNNVSLLGKSLPLGNNLYSFYANHNQIGYFNTIGIHNKEALLASNNFFALNDWLQLTIEFGFLGFIVIAICLLFILNKIRLQTSSNFFNNQTLITAIIIPFHIYIALSYPLHLPIFLSLFIFLNFRLLLITHCKFLLLKFPYKLILNGILVLLFYNIIYQIEKSKNFNNKMNEIQNSNSIGYTSEALQMALELKKDNPKMYESNFLLGNCFYQANKKDTAIIHLENNHRVTCSYEYHLLLGKCYAQVNNLEKAIENYKFALNIIPHKFETRYQLMIIYSKHNLTDSALYFANEILSYPIKIKSPLQNFYMTEANKIIRNTK